MTLCVGLVDGDRVIIGADSQITDDSAWTSAEPKCWEWGPVVLADCGPIRPSQALRYLADDPPPLDREIRAWICGQLVDAIRYELSAEYASKRERRNHEIMVGVGGELAVISASTWGVHFPGESMAIGHPPAVAAARGSIHATGQPWASGTLGLDAVARIRLALEAGAMVSPYVSGPWSFVG